MPLRLPGQSGDERIQERRADALSYFVVAFLAFSFAGWEWYHKLLEVPPQPWPYTIVAVCIAAFCVFKLWRAKSELKRFKQGRDGERIVAEQLEKMRASGYRVLHDVVAGDFNLDHVLIGPTGIFVVETKTPSKRGKGNRITFDGEAVQINGRSFLPNPLKQAKGNAAWLHNILKSSTGKSFWVTPIVTFPDWSVVRTAKDAAVLVLNHKEIEQKVKSRPVMLSNEEVSMAAFHLERFVRTGERKT